jgi:hypothetical protein
VTAAGAPFSAAGFGNFFREWCNEAGLYSCTAHGLRKAQLRRLAEAGCSEHQITAAIHAPLRASASGHRHCDIGVWREDRRQNRDCQTWREKCQTNKLLTCEGGGDPGGLPPGSIISTLTVANQRC